MREPFGPFMVAPYPRPSAGKRVASNGGALRPRPVGLSGFLVEVGRGLGPFGVLALVFGLGLLGLVLRGDLLFFLLEIVALHVAFGSLTHRIASSVGFDHDVPVGVAAHTR